MSDNNYLDFTFGYDNLDTPTVDTDSFNLGMMIEYLSNCVDSDIPRISYRVNKNINEVFMLVDKNKYCRLIIEDNNVWCSCHFNHRSDEGLYKLDLSLKRVDDSGNWHIYITNCQFISNEYIELVVERYKNVDFTAMDGVNYSISDIIKNDKSKYWLLFDLLFPLLVRKKMDFSFVSFVMPFRNAVSAKSIDDFYMICNKIFRVGIDKVINKRYIDFNLEDRRKYLSNRNVKTKKVIK